MKNYTVIVGDTHGCIDELLKLMKEVNYHPDTTELMSVGDLVDKGPYSKEVVSFFRGNNARVVMGNHDDKHRKYRHHENQKKANPSYKNPTKFSEDKVAIYNSLSEDELNWICNLPKTITFGEDQSWIVVHGGLQAGLPLEKQDKCLWLRYIREDTGAMIQFDGTPGAPPGGIWWASKWTGPQKVVYGHQPWDGEVHIENGTYGIDTGCVHGKKLTALVFEGPITKDSKPEIVQVKAAKIYSPDLF